MDSSAFRKGFEIGCTRTELRRAKAFVVTKSRLCGNRPKLLFLMNKFSHGNVIVPDAHATGGRSHFSLAGFKKQSRFRPLRGRADKVIHPIL
ncbi:hypothetical protein OE766_17330 [Pararhizobium sp. YC-54]|uniref:hypothetical protein n=1 Tax=Pararhizobium sp. YC-54 TaxID=2986920 RepID=UPI0021F6B4B6|nr:hypothetical protein [Pararhizobium sp. YC-54]MCW0000004.1 hypothetical protein [Pararhizobium sp. YC-54]